MESYCIANGEDKKGLINPANIISGGGSSGGNVTITNGGGGGVTNTNVTGSGGNNIITNTTSSVQDCDNSPIRKAIVRIAKEYLNKNTKEIYNDRGFVDPTFEKTMKEGIGWWKGAAWCNLFADLVWKEAYTEVGATDPVIKNVFDTTLKGTEKFGVKPPLSAWVYSTAETAEKLGFGKVWLPKRAAAYPKEKSTNLTIGGKDYGAYYGITRNDPRFEMPRPGDMVVYALGHVNIVVEVDYNKKTFKTIGGNEGNPGSVVYSNWWGEKGNPLIYGIVRVIDPNCTSAPNSNIVTNNVVKKDVTAGKCASIATEVGPDPATAVYISPPRKADKVGDFVDVTPSINNKSCQTLAALNDCTYPIKLYTKPGDTSGKVYSKVVGYIGARNNYESNPDFDKNHIIRWSYTSADGKFTKIAYVNKLWDTTLTKMAKELDNAGMWNADHIADWGAGIVKRDVTPGKIIYGLITGHAFGMALDLNSSKYGLGRDWVAKWKVDYDKGVKYALPHKLLAEKFVDVQGGEYPVFWLDKTDIMHFALIKVV